MADPYVHPGTTVLRNKLDISDAGQLAATERAITTAKFLAPPPALDVSPHGYRAIHRYIFEDLYDWAGEYRDVNMAKGQSMFCAPQFIADQMKRRFDAILADADATSPKAAAFAKSLGLHVNELNAIHPFREGNGRVLQIFVQQTADRAGQAFELTRVAPQDWVNASINGFLSGDAKPFEDLISGAIEDD